MGPPGRLTPYRGGVTSPATGSARLLRAGTLALAAVSLALAAHTLAGGQRPGVLPLLAAAVTLTCGAVLMTGRRVGAVSTTAALVAAQAGLHAWFSATTGTGCTLSGWLTGHHAVAVSGSCPPPAAAAAAPDAAPAAMVMAAAHLAAVAATALLLAHGDALLWRLSALARGVLPRVPRSAALLVPIRLFVDRGSSRAVPTPLALAVRRRGPPLAALGG